MMIKKSDLKLEELKILYESFVQKFRVRYNYPIQPIRALTISDAKQIDFESKSGVIFNEQVVIHQNKENINKYLIEFAALIEILPSPIKNLSILVDCIFLGYFQKNQVPEIIKIRNAIYDDVYNQIKKFYRINAADFNAFLRISDIDLIYTKVIPFLPLSTNTQNFLNFIVNFLRSYLPEYTISMIRSIIQNKAIDSPLFKSSEYVLDYPKIGLIPIRFYIRINFSSSYSIKFIEDFFPESVFNQIYMSFFQIL